MICNQRVTLQVREDGAGGGALTRTNKRCQQKNEIASGNKKQPDDDDDDDCCVNLIGIFCEFIAARIMRMVKELPLECQH